MGAKCSMEIFEVFDFFFVFAVLLLTRSQTNTVSKPENATQFFSKGELDPLSTTCNFSNCETSLSGYL